MFFFNEISPLNSPVRKDYLLVVLDMISSEMTTASTSHEIYLTFLKIEYVSADHQQANGGAHIGRCLETYDK